MRKLDFEIWESTASMVNGLPNKPLWRKEKCLTALYRNVYINKEMPSDLMALYLNVYINKEMPSDLMALYRNVYINKGMPSCGIQFSTE